MYDGCHTHLETLMRWMPAAALIVLSALALPAMAQVHKCKDASGRTIYTDAQCAVGQSGGLFERRRTMNEIYEERIQAANAEDRKHLQRMAEQDREWAAQSSRASRPRAAPEARHSGSDWARRKDAANAATSANSITGNNGRWDKAAQAQRARERREQAIRDARSSPPTHMTNCTPGFCHDDQGGTYHRAGPDFMTGPNGQACHRTGDMWNCH